MNDKKILILGGTGSLGKAFTRMTLEHYQPRRITIFSRDEQKQDEMRKQDFRCEFFLGDIRDRDRLNQAVKGHDYVIHAAALKMVHKGETDPGEFIKTNVTGTMNVARACEDAGIEKAVFISTDKAEEPINLYGATKLCAAKLWYASNVYKNRSGRPMFSVVKYGNVMGSRGSVIPLFLEQTREGKPLTITDPNMTRFMFTLEDAVKLIWKALEKGPGEYMPECKSMDVETIARVCIKYVTGGTAFNFKVTGKRPGEKLHERMGKITSDMAERMTEKELFEWLSNSNM